MSQDRTRIGDADEIGFLSGVSSFLGGIGFVLVTPSVWPYAAVPMVTATLLGCGLSAAGFWGAYQAALAWVGEGSSGWARAGQWAVTVSLGAVGMIASVFLALALAQPLSGWALEAVSWRQEKALTGRRRPEPSLLRSLWVSVRVTLFTLAVGTTLVAALTVIGLVVPGAAVVTVPLKFLVLGWLLAWDFLDYPQGLRCRGIRERMAWVCGHFSAFTGFGLAWATVLLIPFVALLVLPFGVAGATRLLVAAEREESAEPLPG